MCWNAWVSTLFTAVGLAAASAVWRVTRNVDMTKAILFFCLMELLQSVQYRRPRANQVGRRRRRGCDVDSPRTRVAATPRMRRGDSAETRVAATPRLRRGDSAETSVAATPRMRRGHSAETSVAPQVLRRRGGPRLVSVRVDGPRGIEDVSRRRRQPSDAAKSIEDGSSSLPRFGRARAGPDSTKSSRS